MGSACLSSHVFIFFRVDSEESSSVFRTGGYIPYDARFCYSVGLVTVGGLVAGQIFFFCACVFAISLNMPGDALPAVALSGSPERKLSSRRRGAAPKFTGGTTGHLRRYLPPPPPPHPNSPASTRSGDHEDAGC